MPEYSLALYWDGNIRHSSSGSVWYEGPIKKIIRVDSRLRYAELLEIIYSKMKLDRKRSDVKVNLRYPVVYGSKVEFTTMDIDDDWRMNMLFDLHSKIRCSCLELYVDEEPINEESVNQGASRMMHPRLNPPDFTGQNYPVLQPNEHVSGSSGQKLDVNAASHKTARVEDNNFCSSRYGNLQSKVPGCAEKIGPSHQLPNDHIAIMSSAIHTPAVVEKNNSLYTYAATQMRTNDLQMLRYWCKHYAFEPNGEIDPGTMLRRKVHSRTPKNTLWNKEKMILVQGIRFYNKFHVALSVRMWSNNLGCEFDVFEDQRTSWEARCRRVNQCSWNQAWRISKYVKDHICIGPSPQPL